MEEVIIGGVTYLPATKLAKQYRYTTDYIGQLCRSKKIDAQLVGRSWYVNPTSLDAHKNGRYAKVSTSKLNTKPVEVEEVKIRVEPVMSKTTVKSLNGNNSGEVSSRNFAKRIDWKPVKYELDESDLLPPLRRDLPPVSLPINLAESSDITIKSGVKLTKLIPDELPEVSLKGSVRVVSLNEYFDTKPEAEVGLSAIPAEELPKQIETEPEQISAKVNLNKRQREEFAYRVKRVETVVVEENVEEGEGWTFLSIASVTVACFLLVAGLLTLEHEVSATANSYAAGIGFSVEEYHLPLAAF